MNCSFCSLVEKYDSSVQQGKVFFAYSEKNFIFTNESRLMRLFHRIFWNYSFNLTKNIQKLIKKCPSRPELLSENEEISLLKVCGIVSKMLFHSTRKNPPTTFIKERSTLYRKIDQIAERVSKRLGISKVQVLLKNGCQDNAYTFVKNGIFDPNIPKSDLEPILQMACEKKDTNTAFLLLNFGVSSLRVQGIPPSFFLELAEEAARRLEDKVLASLIRDQNEVSSKGSLYLKAAELGLIESVKAFVSAGKVPLQYVDKDKNTALHHAFPSGNIPLIQFLFNHIDPTLENKNKKTALSEFLSDTSGLNCQIPESTIPEFLAILLERPQDIFQGVSPKNRTFTIRKIQKKLNLDYIELFFLHNIPITKLSSSIQREDLDASYSFLSKKYPCGINSVNAFCMQAFSLNKNHLNTGCTQHKIPEKVPNNVQIRALQTLFDSIEWQNEDISKVYLDVFENPPLFYENQKTRLQEQLLFFLERLAKKEHFLGTPLGGNALKEFYKNIELALRHCCAKLLEKHNSKLTLAFIKEILRASKYCGGRYFQTAINQYLLICKELVTTPRGFLEKLLAEYRQLCFEGIVTEMTQGAVHGLTNASRDLGEELGIPGSHTTFADRYTTELYKKDAIRKTFFEDAYTPYSIVFDHLFPLLSQDAEAADKYIDLHKEIIPSWWKEEKYRPLYEELQAISSLSESETKTKEENKILQKYDIARMPKMSAQEAIEDDRLADYLGTFVHDENGKRTFSGLIYTLEKLGIISCSLPYKDSSKKVEPLPKQDAYRKVSLWDFISSVGSFVKRFFW